MKRNSRLDSDDYDRLREMGFHFKNSQGEFTYQPDSGSRSGGKRGEQEDGVLPDFDAEGRREERDHDQGEIILSYGPDDMERGQEAALYNSRAKGVAAGNRLSDDDLHNLIERRILNHPDLSVFSIDVEVREHNVILSGLVSTQAEKLRLTELIESLPGVALIRNEVEIAV